MKEWSVDGNVYELTSNTPRQPRLDKGVYIIRSTPLGSLYLVKIADHFSFPYKIYGKDDVFVQRVVKTFEMSKTNLGVLLNGTKGTGKTVTAEQIFNAAELPVILVTSYVEDLPSFINQIPHEVGIFFDEYDKTYRDHDSSLLSVMDGALNSRFRRLFIMTTNANLVSANMLQRPGRIRYLKTYTDLDIATIEEIVTDLLVKKDYYLDVVEFISHLETITIDIVKSIVSEVNIHNELPKKFESFFNVKTKRPFKDVYEVTAGDRGFPVEKQIAFEAEITPKVISRQSVEKKESFYIDGIYYGYISRIVSQNTIEVIKEVTNERAKTTTKKVMVYRIAHNIPLHSSFADEGSIIM